MQPSYGVPDIHRHQQNQRLHHQFIKNDDCCSSVFPISNPSQNLNHSFQQKQQPEQQIFLQQQQPTITHQLFQNQPQYQHFRPFQQQIYQHPQSTHPPFFPAKFKSDLDNDKKATTDFLNGVTHSWHPQEDSTSIKEPFWKQLSRSNCENGEQEADERNKNKYRKPLGTREVDERWKDLENKYRLFGELEAIYSLAKVAETNQTGSGSALTGENSPTKNIAALSLPFTAIHAQNIANASATSNHGSDNSTGEESSLRKTQKRLRKRKMKEKLTSMAGFFENLVKQVMDHQEMLHKKFLEVIERMDKERTEREEVWRRKEAEKYNREAISRAHDQALASNREAQIVSFVEKITGQRIDLPIRKTHLLLQQEVPKEPNEELIKGSDAQNRWPKNEVEALIQVRSGIESKFQEPGLKGPLWEEVSYLMGTMGYQRSAKRCKEKWENINKYFRKAKESRKKRAQQSKTCSYFNQLDQLYSKAVVNSSPLISNSEIGIDKEGYSELLEAFITGSAANPSRLEFDGSHEMEKEEEVEDDNEEEGSDGNDNEIGMVN
ncbi:hypothetical protein JCGZ_07606 [Jatropha curcas]|uniref:Myb-like domain-containing protein n=1 Tax=Jatropha curcas TaxID=180498 RepID=A0A067KP10_JATCU|nr:trihelix transcription factor GT-2 isoform X2 [Jatropha curcas]KDP34035.1 hypothetical protein JCGZ_07606 [Jatropha curcas]